MLSNINVFKFKNKIRVETKKRNFMKNYKFCNETKKYVSKTDSSTNSIKCTLKSNSSIIY